jgi:heptaprenyl diphosphate synthase
VNVGDLLNLPELKNDLSRVDVALRGSVVSEHPFLSEVAAHLILAGGKRLRPSMAIAAAMTLEGGPVAEEVILGGAAVELVHLGSLYHDDVLDGAETRRTVASANAQYGNFMAIIAGDYLLAKASGIAAQLGTETTALLAGTISSLCEGQVWEHRFAFDPGRTVEAYEACISGKTASLIAASARIGAIGAGAPRPHVDALTTFAHSFGMAFQIRDDILDTVSTDEELGKPAGNDLVEGVYTLPVIFALEDTSIAEQLRPLLKRNMTDDMRDQARDIVRASGGCERALTMGNAWANRALEALESLEQTAMTSQLVEMAADLLTDIPRHHKSSAAVSSAR